MCGRYSITTPEEALRALFEYGGPPRNLRARYNAAPSQELPIVRRKPRGERVLDVARWGLIPSWAGESAVARNLINARADTVAAKPSFRTAFRERRCLVPADGFYEWQGEGAGKQPYRIELPGRAPFAFAGLWESWTPTADTALAGAGHALESFAIVTTDASPTIAAIHHRMPVILPEPAWQTWLDPDSSASTLQNLLVAYVGPIEAYKVSRRVNNVRNDDETCLAPLDEATPAPAAAPAPRKRAKRDAKQGSLF
ncbi:MAG: SOS response-associated peptidase [Alphaproteobacteria bacterium]